ncbi:hypothetical protein ACIBG7_01435 [Nonomuraea sp. NPDC050328]|uniref:hypothetical protein n=1 Tax=Nonomuraea sp. NPDC050328 TaxID=3364361 RepID=UPI00378CC55C
MKRRMRLLFATVTGAAVLSSTFVASSAASAQSLAACTLTATDVTKITLGDSYIPLKDDLKVDLSVAVKDPYGPKATEYPVVDTTKDASPAPALKDRKWVVKPVVTSATAEIFRTGETTASQSIALTGAPGDLPVPQTADGIPETTEKLAVAAVPESVDLKGQFVIKETDKDKAGKWTVKVTVTRTSGGNTAGNCQEFDVSGKQEVASGSVSPSTIQLKRGQDVPVRITASVKNATGVSAELRPHDGSMWINVPLTKEGDGNYRYTAYLADDTSPGSWYLVIKGTRGKEAIEATGMSFTILAPEDGVAPKASSKVTIKAPKKAKLGKAFKIYGKAYRGSKGYSGKVLELYFKKKGKKSFTFYGFAKATSTGVWAKNVKQKYDGYWRVVVPGTSKTKKSYANSSLVDVK